MADLRFVGAIRTFSWTELPFGWRFELVENVCTVRRGASPRPAGDPRYFGGGIPWFKIGDATVDSSRFLAKTQDFVTEEGAKHSVRIPAGSLIVANSGVSLGFAVITKTEGCIHDGWLWFKDFDGVDRDYLAYCINYLTPRIRDIADGTTQPNLNTSIARKLLFPLPPLPEQRAIAHILGALDDKIELNRQMNQTLEAIARAIFKSWFVDFDPVHAKAEGRAPIGIDAATTDFFPDAFIPSELGLIPEGWKVEKIDTLVTLKRNSVQPNKSPDEIFYHFSIPAFNEGKMPKLELGVEIKSNKYLVLPECILLSKLNPRFPRIWLPTLENDHRSICSTEFLVASQKNNSSREYLYSLFNSHTFLAVFEKLVTGTSSSHQRVTPKSFLNMDVIVPPHSLIQVFTDLVQPLHQKAIRNLFESRTLTQLRDTLLPKLISGQLRVPEALEQMHRKEKP